MLGGESNTGRTLPDSRVSRVYTRLVLRVPPFLLFVLCYAGGETLITSFLVHRAECAVPPR
mgnify:CR=1 FL=1